MSRPVVHYRAMKNKNEAWKTERILVMKSREIDCAIAEKVMGLPPVQVLRDGKGSIECGDEIRGWSECPACASTHDCDESECLETKAWLADIGDFYLPLEYSTDTAAAVSALEHHGKNWRLSYQPNYIIGSKSPRLYHITIDQEETGQLDYRGGGTFQAPTLAHAACLALLRAVAAQGKG